MLKGVFNSMCLAIKYNGAQITRPDDGYIEDVRSMKKPQCAIFFVCSKAAHSCCPNIHWYDRAPEDGGGRVVRSLKPIKKGAE